MAGLATATVWVAVAAAWRVWVGGETDGGAGGGGAPVDGGGGSGGDGDGDISTASGGGGGLTSTNHLPCRSSGTSAGRDRSA